VRAALRSRVEAGRGCHQRWLFETALATRRRTGR
jgi:hypothetical protein